VAVTRCANLYGGGDLNRSRLVPETVAAALAGRAPVIRSDGSPERDFLYVEDAVAAYLGLADALDSDDVRGEAFNAGWGRSWPVHDVVAAVCRAVGADVQPDIRGTGTPEGEIDRQWVDSSRLRALTGWEPRFDLESGLARTVAWYREHPAALGEAH
jgi:CDP-glucose 4,6-dehydratase